MGKKIFTSSTTLQEDKQEFSKSYRVHFEAKNRTKIVTVAVLRTTEG